MPDLSELEEDEYWCSECEKIVTYSLGHDRDCSEYGNEFFFLTPKDY